MANKKPAKPARRYLPEGSALNAPTGLPAAKRPGGLAVTPNAAQAGGTVGKTRGATAQGDSTLGPLTARQKPLQNEQNAAVNNRATGVFLPGGTASTPRTTPRRRGR